MDALIDRAKARSAVFAFSAAHICEMSPLEARTTDSAAARADLLVRLCGRNCMVSFDTLIKAEIRNLSLRRSDPIDTFSTMGNWFPEIDDLLAPIRPSQFLDEFKKELERANLTPQQRKIMKKRFFRNGVATAECRAFLNKQALAADVSEVLKQYPMKPEHAKTLLRYCMGQGSNTSAEDALLESLRDPSWMMRWFAEHHQQLTFLIEWLRAPAANFISQLRDLTTAAANLHRIGLAAETKLLTSTGWREYQESTLLGLANKLLAYEYPQARPAESSALIDEYCPGLSTMFRTLHSSLRMSLLESPRKLKDSDFIDAIHAAYAPYVRFFRADRYMAQFLAPYASPHGCRVAPSIDDLLRDIS